MLHRKLLVVAMRCANAITMTMTMALCIVCNPHVLHAQNAGIVRVTIETSSGTMEAALDSAHAPITVSNFLRDVDAHQYDGGRFHRTVTVSPDNQPANTVKIEVIQGGVSPAEPKTGWPAIELERTNITHILHDDNVLSMARGGPNSATSDFFITIGAQHELDFGGKRNADGQGFAAFGRITRGAEVVRAIQHSPANGQNLMPPITIVRISRVK